MSDRESYMQYYGLHMGSGIMTLWEQVQHLESQTAKLREALRGVADPDQAEIRNAKPDAMYILEAVLRTWNKSREMARKALAPASPAPAESESAGHPFEPGVCSWDRCTLRPLDGGPCRCRWAEIDPAKLPLGHAFKRGEEQDWCVYPAYPSSPYCGQPKSAHEPPESATEPEPPWQSEEWRRRMSEPAKLPLGHAWKSFPDDLCCEPRCKRPADRAAHESEPTKLPHRYVPCTPGSDSVCDNTGCHSVESPNNSGSPCGQPSAAHEPPESATKPEPITGPNIATAAEGWTAPPEEP